MTPDLINGLFEACGGLLMLLDIKVIIRDRAVRGVYWPSRIFFLVWGGWNVYFYSYYDHIWSWLGGAFMLAVNAVWVFLAWYYSRKQRMEKCNG